MKRIEQVFEELESLLIVRLEQNDAKKMQNKKRDKSINIPDRSRRNSEGMGGETKSPDLIQEVKNEIERAVIKFPAWPTDPLHALAVLGEEYGELTKAVLQVTYEPSKSTIADVRCEAIQTAAMALRFAMSLDRYVYKAAAQHNQDGQ